MPVRKSDRSRALPSVEVLRNRLGALYVSSLRTFGVFTCRAGERGLTGPSTTEVACRVRERAAAEASPAVWTQEGRKTPHAPHNPIGQTPLADRDEVIRD